MLAFATLPLVALAALFAVRRWRAIAYALGAVALVPPWLPSLAPPIVRFVLAIGACGGLARIVELVREHDTPARRVLRALTIVDWRTATRAPRFVDLRALFAALSYATVAGLSLLALLRTRPGVLWPAWILGAITVWSFAEAMNAVFAFGFGLAGVRLAPLHDRPLASRSLGELWGRRWNLTVSRWLHATVFAPLARRRHAALGVVATFVTSALFHAYVAGAAGGALVGGVMATFFVVQGVLMLVERVLPVRGRRVWFLLAVLVPSPLFIEPMIAIVKPMGSPLGQHAARIDAQPSEARQVRALDGAP